MHERPTERARALLDGLTAHAIVERVHPYYNGFQFEGEWLDALKAAICDELDEVDAKVRDQKADAYNDMVNARLDADALQAENAKLRELVNVMAYCMQQGRDCDGCATNGADGVVTAPSGCDWLRDRMREMGVSE